MKDYQKEYEAYMKQVTDGFVEMQPEESVLPFKGRIPYKVVWDGGLIYKLDLNYDLHLIGIDYEEVKIHNSEIAKKYLDENTLTYDEWAAKHKTNP